MQASCLADDAALLCVLGKLLDNEGATTQQVLDGGRPAALHQLWVGGGGGDVMQRWGVATYNTLHRHTASNTHFVLKGENLLEHVLASDEYGGFEEDVRFVDAAIGLPPSDVERKLCTNPVKGFTHNGPAHGAWRDVELLDVITAAHRGWRDLRMGVVVVIIYTSMTRTTHWRCLLGSISSNDQCWPVLVSMHAQGIACDDHTSRVLGRYTHISQQTIIPANAPLMCTAWPGIGLGRDAQHCAVDTAGRDYIQALKYCVNAYKING